MMEAARPWTLYSQWMKSSDSIHWQKLLLSNLSWNSPVVNVYGRQHVVPRRTTFLAEKGITYCYSGFKHFACGWPNWFFPLLEQIRNKSSSNFNGCLLNLYRNGNLFQSNLIDSVYEDIELESGMEYSYQVSANNLLP